MPPKYPIPKPEFFARLKKNPLLASEDQQATLEQYATGEIGVETTVARILADARARGPVLQAERDANAAERARRVRVQREMALNETAEGPKFVECDEHGNPLVAKQAPAEGDEEDDNQSEDKTTAASGSKPGHGSGDQEIGQNDDQDEGPEQKPEEEVDEDQFNAYEQDKQGKNEPGQQAENDEPNPFDSM